MGWAKNRAMELEGRGFGEVDGALCLEHVVDVALAERLAAFVTERECAICGRVSSDGGGAFALAFEDLVEVVMETLRHFYADADAVLPWDSEDHELVGPQTDTWEAVNDVAGRAFDEENTEQITERIIEAIGDNVSWTSWFTGADLDDLDYAWDQFAGIAKYQSRMVVGLGSPTDPPGSLARYLDSVLVYASDALSLVKSLPAGTPLYRGRLCEVPSSIRRNATDLGPAPRGEAAANRMSPAGISYFYASGDAQTAVAEIAGHGVEPFAVIGQFTTTRHLRILDLTERPSLISPFDLERREHARMARFLTSFVSNVTVPVIPDGRQHVEYAPTQILTEFLRWVPEPKLDGIALPSAQTGNKTYVLFFDGGDCRTLGAPEPARSSSFFSLGDGRPDEQALCLDPEDVTTYRVERTYRATEADWHRAAPPWDAPP